MRWSMLVAFGLVTAGCSALHVRTPTMEADPPQTGAEGIALTNQLWLAYRKLTPSEIEAGLCDHTLPQHHDSQSQAYLKYHGRGQGSGTPADPFKCLVFRTGSAEDYLSHVDAGFALTDLYCDEFFRRVGQHSSQRHYARGIVNDVGSAVAAALGLASAAPQAVGGTALGFGLVDSSLRQYDDVFLVQPDLGALQTRVLTEQAAFRANLDPAKITSYPKANSIILRYANLCSFVGMRGLVNASLAQAKAEQPGEVASDQVNAAFTTAKKAKTAIAPPAKTEASPPASNETK